jgi:histidinol phosphatase-like enzyme
MTVVVIDFDLTLIKDHSMYNLPRGNKEKHDFINAETFDFDKNTEQRISKELFYKNGLNCIDYLYKKKIPVIIASFGSKLMIEDSFSQLKLRKKITKILTPRSFTINGRKCRDFSRMNNKNKMLDYVKNNYNVEYKDIILIDDRKSNIDGAYLLGCKTIHSKDGFTGKVFDTVKTMLLL